jgi:superfamily II DNA or RNA helicase
MADFRAAASFWNRMPCVVSTVQTQVAGNNGKGRMARFDPMDFGLVICDEAHHFVSPQNRRVLDYYRQN